MGYRRACGMVGQREWQIDNTTSLQCDLNLNALNTIRQRRLLLIGHTLRADAKTPLCDLIHRTIDTPLRRGLERTLTL